MNLLKSNIHSLTYIKTNPYAVGSKMLFRSKTKIGLSYTVEK